MGSNDVFVSVAGGLKITEPAVDLAVMTAIVSSLLNKPVNSKMIVAGEVGLSGEIRTISMADRRVAEAKRMGFEIFVLPKSNCDLPDKGKIKLNGVEDIQSALESIL